MAPRPSKPTPPLRLFQEEAPAAGLDNWDDPPEPVPATVRVRCIVHTRPHTHQEALDFGQEAEVPADVAALMKERGQVE